MYVFSNPRVHVANRKLGFFVPNRRWGRQLGQDDDDDVGDLPIVAPSAASGLLPSDAGDIIPIPLIDEPLSSTLTPPSNIPSVPVPFTTTTLLPAGTTAAQAQSYLMSQPGSVSVAYPAATGLSSIPTWALAGGLGLIVLAFAGAGAKKLRR